LQFILQQKNCNKTVAKKALQFFLQQKFCNNLPACRLLNPDFKTLPAGKAAIRPARRQLSLTQILYYLKTAPYRMGAPTVMPRHEASTATNRLLLPADADACLPARQASVRNRHDRTGQYIIYGYRAKGLGACKTSILR
jgi:hypothetical protein